MSGNWRFEATCKALTLEHTMPYRHKASLSWPSHTPLRDAESALQCCRALGTPPATVLLRYWTASGFA